MLRAHAFPSVAFRYLVEILPHLRPQRFVVTGARGALGGAFVKQLTSRGAASVKTLVCGKDYMRTGEDYYAFAKGLTDVSLCVYTSCPSFPHSPSLSLGHFDQEDHLDQMLCECDVLLLAHGVRDSTVEGCYEGNCLSQVNSSCTLHAQNTTRLV